MTSTASVPPRALSGGRVFAALVTAFAVLALLAAAVFTYLGYVGDDPFDAFWFLYAIALAVPAVSAGALGGAGLAVTSPTAQWWLAGLGAGVLALPMLLAAAFFGLF
ncbi:hypothetical protein [Nocardioides acrostichi]|uniref:Uncharacterized protein n=1 Tax=Nocardioides acrostichi TaxID=2784339 RepID=A0A930UUW0_9ACTN|nr:hypothetical protein [Nocardioides acrostichi]MBF4161283.1 hypothetical protein [Nocardioides acrostichi]